MAGYTENDYRKGGIVPKAQVFVLWEWGKDGVKQEELPHVRQAAYAGVFSGDGKLFAHRNQGSIWLYIWGVTKEAPGLRTKLEGISSYAFSPDGKLLITNAVGTSRKLTFWDLTRQTPKAMGAVTLSELSGGLDFSPDGQILSEVRLGRLRLRKVADLRRCLGGKEQPVVPPSVRLPCSPRTLCFSPDGRKMVLGGTDGTVRLWDVARGVELFPPVGHCGQVEAAFAPDGKALATVSDSDRTLRLWKLTGAKPRQLAVRTFPEKEEAPDRVAFSPGGDLIATYRLFYPSVRLWRWRDSKLEPLRNSAPGRAYP